MNFPYEIVIAVVASNGFWVLLQNLITKREKAKDASTQMLIGLGHDKLWTLGAKYIRRGAITVSEKSNLKMIYYPYHEMGGNSDGTTIFDECMKLPVITQDDADEKDKEIRRKEWKE